MLRRDGLLTTGNAFGWNESCEREVLISNKTSADHMILTYRHRSGSDEWRPMDYAVRLDWTACTYGSARFWFLCPAEGCGRRVAKLDIGRVGAFACRHCYRLA